MTPGECAAVISQFSARLGTAIDYHKELLLAVHLKQHQAGLETMLAEQFVLNAAVLWEVFVSDLLIAYLVAAPAPYAASLKGKMQQALRNQFGNEAARIAHFNNPGVLSTARASALVDPKNFNVTATSAAALTDKANALLAARYAKRFSFDVDTADFLDFVLAVRNYLGHRSSGSRQRLKEVVTRLSGPNAALNSSVRNVGAYLKGRIGDSPRSVEIGHRLVAVAKTLG